jgi:glycosyltransferase involved in cell wall biosynthesis
MTKKPVKIVYIISNINKAIAFEWIAEELDKTKFELNFILLNPKESYLEEYLNKLNINVKRINYNSKRDIPLSILRIIYFLLLNKPSVVHTHLFDASFIGLIAAKLCGIKKRIYTRHYSTYHHDFFPNAVKWDKLNNKFATRIIAISEVVKDVLISKEGVAPEKISLVYHGFKLNKFSGYDNDVIEKLKSKYNPTNKRPVIGVISRFTELKGIQFIIPAFSKLLNQYPDALLLLFNASGDYEKEINKLLSELPKETYLKVVFENEITSIYHLFDVFIHVPINDTIEAFGQTYIESMASGIPLIATKSGIGNEILINNDNSIVVPYKNTEAIYKAIALLFSDSELKNKITNNAKNTVAQKFEIHVMIEKLETIYLQ